MEVYISTNDQNPSEYIGGNWESFGQGKTIVGVDNSDSDFSKSKLGDAIKEVFSNNNYGWNGDVMAFGISNSPWIRRGGYYNNGEYGGAFALRSYTGDVYADYSFRVVLSLE